MAALQKIDLVNGTVTTTDSATTTTVCTFTVPSGSVASILAILVGRDGAGNGATAEAAARVRNVSGVLTSIGSTTSIISFATGSDAILATCSMTIDVSGTTVRLRVNGIAATTIDWLGEMKIYLS